MPAEIKQEIELEIAHVLFIDIVAYSKMAMDDQRAAIEKLNRIVQSTDEFRKAESENRLLKPSATMICSGLPFMAAMSLTFTATAL